MSKQNRIGELDTAILEHIFTLLAPKKFAPHKRLVPLLRVNKHWHEIGRRRMYTSISLKGQWVSRPLRKTLQKNKALAALVSELVMDTELSSQDPKETLDHVQIIAACLNLQHLTILGYAPNDVHTYREAIASRSSLVALNISEGGGMFSFAQLLEMMPGWPKLEKLILKNILLPSDTPSLPSPGQPCSVLKMVKIIDKLDDDRHFSFSSFAALAPSVSVLWVQPQRGLPDDLLDALRVWAPTLEALCLVTDAEMHLETILPQLASLRHLDIWSQILSPSTITHAPASLEALTYRVFPPQLLDLSEALAAPSVAPALKAIEIKGAFPPGGMTPMKFTPTALQSIRAVCKRRRIRLTL
ncbi:hypothetical protein B0H10DRAFT_11211 [Mycena sp. CBHHK59/15]|nr:hypothetical protein B0H10DRAFT_11211 [Mycena sp. CBHHK59/15]